MSVKVGKSPKKSDKVWKRPKSPKKSEKVKKKYKKFNKVQRYYKVFVDSRVIDPWDQIELCGTPDELVVSSN